MWHRALLPADRTVRVTWRWLIEVLVVAAVVAIGLRLMGVSVAAEAPAPAPPRAWLEPQGEGELPVLLLVPAETLRAAGDLIQAQTREIEQLRRELARRPKECT